MKNLKQACLKQDFPFFANNPNLVYVDNAATTHKPQAFLDRIRRFYVQEYAPIHRGFYDLAEAATEHFEAARKRIADFIGAQPQEIIFTINATAGIHLVAQSWACHNLKKGDEIVLTELEHHANLVPWLQVAKMTGAHIRYIPILSSGDLDYSKLDTIINERTKLVAITQISNVLGTEVDVDRVITQAKKVGAKVLIDACQSACRRTINAKAQNFDFLVFSGHKMLGPVGIGVLFVNRKIHAQMTPFWGGGGTVQTVDYDNFTWRDVPACFEAGTPSSAAVLGLGAALDYIHKNIDFTLLQEQEARLCTALIDGLSNIKKIKILGPLDQLKKSGHIVSFLVDGIHAHDVAAYLSKQGICVRAGHHCAQPLHTKLGIAASVRVSFHGAYNTLEDVAQILQAVEKMVEKETLVLHQVP